MPKLDWSRSSQTWEKKLWANEMKPFHRLISFTSSVLRKASTTRYTESGYRHLMRWFRPYKPHLKMLMNWQPRFTHSINMWQTAYRNFSKANVFSEDIDEYDMGNNIWRFDWRLCLSHLWFLQQWEQCLKSGNSKTLMTWWKMWFQ